MIRQFAYLDALVRTEHFGRAAAACNVTQPTLSAGIKQLEHTLGLPIVQRGRRYHGLTPDGQRVLEWAQRILADWHSLNQEIVQAREGRANRMRIGVVPAALSMVAHVTTPFVKAHPLVTLTVLSQSATAIQRALQLFEIDIGVTYLDDEPLANIVRLPLYTERYLMLTPSDGPFAGRHSVSWREAAVPPLCLLTEDMQNRRILNGLFRSAGAEPHVGMETDTITTLLSQVRVGGMSSIIPHSLLALVADQQDFIALPLVQPAATHVVGLIANDRQPQPPLTAAMFAAARRCGIAARLDTAWQTLTQQCGNGAAPR
jgi:DNA-binding transcriptional LysR family regulator